MVNPALAASCQQGHRLYLAPLFYYLFIFQFFSLFELVLRIRIETVIESLANTTATCSLTIVSFNSYKTKATIICIFLSILVRRSCSNYVIYIAFTAYDQANRL